MAKTATLSPAEELAQIKAELAAARQENEQLKAAVAAKKVGRGPSWAPMDEKDMAAADTFLGRIQRADRDVQVEALAKLARQTDAAPLASLVLAQAEAVAKAKSKTVDDVVTAILTAKTRNRKSADDAGKKVADATA